MDLNLIWKTLLIFVVATALLRFGGRKSISQLTIPQAVIMFSLGTLIIQPVAGHGLWTTFLIAAILIASLIVTELIELSFDKSESFITGKSVVVIENGRLSEKNLKKLRLTVDQLEALLRQAGITAVADVQYATIESNGQIGYTLKQNKQFATKEDIQRLIHLIQTGHLMQQTQTPAGEDLFKEIQSDDPTPPPDRLQ